MSRNITALIALLFVACGGSGDQKTAPGGSQPAGAAQRVAQQPLPTGTLDQMLGPIALYPDPLLAQMLMSAGEPAKIVELDAWLETNQNLKGTQLQDAAVRAGFEPSLVALALFPQVVARMADQIAWTTLLGQAFAADRNAVFASIQKLRQQAQNVGTLKSTPQQEVATKTTSAGESVIVIEPANPQVVYVPQYNTEVVYTQPPTTTIVIQEDNSADEAIAAGLIGFTAGIAIGASMDNHYYYGPYGWYGGAYMYNDAWDDYYDHREDAREDWMDHREDLVEERSDRLEDRQEQVSDRRENVGDQRTERQQTRQDNRPESQAQRSATQGAATQRATERATPNATRQGTAAQGASAQAQRTQPTGSPEARGYGGASRGQLSTQRSGGSSDPFAGYSSGASQRSSSARGQQSRGSARGGGGGGRRR